MQAPRVEGAPKVRLVVQGREVGVVAVAVAVVVAFVVVVVAALVLGSLL